MIKRLNEKNSAYGWKGHKIANILLYLKNGGSRLKGLSHEMDFASDDMYSIVSSRPKEGTGLFLNFVDTPLIL